MEYRVFKFDVGWGYGVFYFPLNINWKMIKSHIRTSNLNKKDYIGKYDFNNEYLNIFESDLMWGIKYYYLYYIET